MTKRLVATAAAAAIALTTVSAAPARALDSGELGRLILGAGAAIVIGSALSNHNKRNRTNKVYKYNNHVPVQRRNVVQVPSYCIHGYGHNRWVDWNCARRAGYGY